MTDRKATSQCRIALYDQYRNECHGKGPECSLVKSCSQFGVGGEHWPVNVWSLPKESFAALTPEVVKKGRDCMTGVMWSDTATDAEGKSWGTRLQGCGGRVPQFNVAAAAAAAAAAGGAIVRRKKAALGAAKKKSPVAAKKKAVIKRK